MKKILSLILFLLSACASLPPPVFSATSVSEFIPPCPQFANSAGVPYAGGTLTFWTPGTSTLKSVYTDSTGTVALTNPVILDSTGRACPWLSGYYRVQLADAQSNIIWTVDNVSSMPNTTLTQSEWVAQSLTFTYISTVSFSTPGDQTATFQVNRRIQTVNSGGTKYGTITASSYAGGITTVTVLNDSGSLDSGLSAVSLGVLGANNQSIPAVISEPSVSFSSSTTVNFTGPVGMSTTVSGNPTFSGNTNFAGKVTSTLSAAATYSRIAPNVQFKTTDSSSSSVIGTSCTAIPLNVGFGVPTSTNAIIAQIQGALTTGTATGYEYTNVLFYSDAACSVYLGGNSNTQPSVSVGAYNPITTAGATLISQQFQIPLFINKIAIIYAKKIDSLVAGGTSSIVFQFVNIVFD